MMEYKKRLNNSSCYWIWYPGDFEIYHSMHQNFSREERGFLWPAYWYIDSCRKNVRFQKKYTLENKTDFIVYANCLGYVCVNGYKYKFQEKICVESGIAEVQVFAGSPNVVPAIFIEGEIICTEKSWLVDDFVTNPISVGWNERYTLPEQNPAVWEYEEQYVKPVMIEEKQGGTLYDFGTELTAQLEVRAQFQACESIYQLICYGESPEEAMDTKWCYYSEVIESAEAVLRKRAFRYVYIPETKKSDFILSGRHLYVDIPVKASFFCKDEQLNQIWETAVRTFRLCSGIFFIDGVKRDRWIWSGDAYQSYFVNPYVLFDEEINKRTMLALRGNDPIRQHINTIVDYSMYWMIGIERHYEMTADREFLKMIYPRMVTMLEFLEQQLDENGFLIGRKKDWIFIDWAEIDKDGPVCAEQILFVACYRAMSRISQIIGLQEDKYENQYKNLVKKIDEFYWDSEQQAYIDSFTSGKRHVSRHANIFAILFEITDRERVKQIYHHVLTNVNIPRITTPYFKFYELEVMCLLGKKKEVLEEIREYWGGMLNHGKDTFWEEYDPQKANEEQYGMYGDPYGKSLCHAWAASPIYLLGRYYIGLRETSPGYETFEISPETKLLGRLDCEFPVKSGIVRVDWNGEYLKIWTDRMGGILKHNGNIYSLYAGTEVIVECLDGKQ